MIPVPKIIVIGEDDVIDGRHVVAGQVIVAPDNYANVRRVLRDVADVKNRNKSDFFIAGLKKLDALLAADYPQIWKQFHANVEIREKIITRLREEPEYLQRALVEIEWFVEMLKKGKNADKNIK